MTRKRFIKLLMAEGFSRNDAAEIAKQAGPNMPYTRLYERALCGASWGRIKHAVDRMAGLFRAVGITADEAAKAFKSWTALTI